MFLVLIRYRLYSGQEENTADRTEEGKNKQNKVRITVASISMSEEVSVIWSIHNRLQWNARGPKIHVSFCTKPRPTDLKNRKPTPSQSRTCKRDHNTHIYKLVQRVLVSVNTIL